MAEKSSPPDAKLMRLNDEHLRAAEPDAAATSRPPAYRGARLASPRRLLPERDRPRPAQSCPSLDEMN